MQQFTLSIPDGKVAFFMELIKNLGFVGVTETPAPVLTQEQIELVEAERNKIKSNPDYLLSWEDARKTLRLD